MKITFVSAICIFSFFTSCTHFTTQHSLSLVNPFVGIAQTQINPSSPISCEEPPPAMVDVMSVTYYTDSHHSVIDPEKQKKSREMVKDLSEFGDHIAMLSDRIWNYKDPEAETCLYKWYSSWINAGALLGKANFQGGFRRKWALSGLALSYLKIESLVSWTPDQKKSIESWLARIAKIVRSEYEDQSERQSKRNNHLYWAALATMATAIINDEKELFEWSVSKARRGLKDVTSKGFLPEELDRASRARHDHSFALQPLMMIAFLARPNGYDLFSENNQALHRLALTTTEGYKSESVFEEATSVKQEPIGIKDLSWIIIYNFLNPRKINYEFDQTKPIIDTWLGGDLTATFQTTTKKNNTLIAAVPFVLHDNRILVETKINGQGPFDFVFDTGGARSNTITPAVVKKLGLTPIPSKKATGAGSGSVASWKVDVGDYSVGELEFKNQPFHVLDMTAIQKAFNFSRLDGIIGFGVLEKAITCIDFERQLLIFKNGEPDCFNSKDKVILPLKIVGDSPIVSGKINGIPGEFFLDTGDRSAFSVFQKFAKSSGIEKLFGKQKKVISGVGIGGAIPAQLTTLESIELGNKIKMTNVLARLPLTTGGFFAKSNLSGSIGNEILRRFNIILNYQKKEITLVKNKFFNDPYKFIPPNPDLSNE